MAEKFPRLESNIKKKLTRRATARHTKRACSLEDVLCSQSTRCTIAVTRLSVASLSMTRCHSVLRTDLSVVMTHQEFAKATRSKTLFSVGVRPHPIT